MEKKKEVKKLSCKVCKTKIPKSSASTSEGSDYTYHFCSKECSSKWKKKFN